MYLCKQNCTKVESVICDKTSHDIIVCYYVTHMNALGHVLSVLASKLTCSNIDIANKIINLCQMQ